MTPEQLTGKATSHLTEVMVGNKAFLLHPAVKDDLLALRQAALDAGYNFHIASGFRDFERQRVIWNNKMAGQAAILDADSQPLDPATLSERDKVFAILRWSALPGGSRHHWGGEFDVYDRDALPSGTSLKLEPWEYFDGHQSGFYQWLKSNLSGFGFFFPYADDLGGVAIEPWHISHVSTAQQCQQQLSCELLRNQLQTERILGADVIFEQLETIYNRYITNISQVTI
ncbi:M15 family metallopeptidase [Vibrio sp. V39_P1S14PM300]|uniref:M15 family metallopeptidase n=1 Tax=Vibrio sp. V39_P1S14PM300 TaxID=1938690 RepID=UPI001372BC5E|nr:M15 family metallopeptidase [Vibrio sp. V39_P1S14PM300]NAX23350.1 D-alanyl-D-alanine carboxypeptidase family protein [Vibrio sp. V39_P1S14PM300]